jgi:hypothetical protein
MESRRRNQYDLSSQPGNPLGLEELSRFRERASSLGVWLGRPESSYSDEDMYT